MISVEDRVAVHANNIANASTFGFKRQLAVQRGYEQAYYPNARNPHILDLEIAPGGGLKTIETFSNFGNGVVTNTGNALDIALIGPAFLRVADERGEWFTRSGRLSVGPGGTLMTADGMTVLDVNDAPIDVSGGRPGFDAGGNVIVNNEIRGTLSLLEFQDPHALQREGYTLYRAPAAARATAVEATNTTVAGGSIENSNVVLPIEMTGMLTALRAYAANQRVIQSVNETTGRMITQVGGVN
jgi:flagellar basal-body rod protein FlgG